MADRTGSPTGRRVPAPFDLRGRTAVVTGAGSPSGIGYAVASLLVELGASVVVAATTDRIHQRATELQAEADRRGEQRAAAVGFVGDLTDEDTCRALVALAVRQTGRLDILVNNAGMVAVGDGDYLAGTIDDMPPERWVASMQRNVDTAYLMCRSALPHLRESDTGRVVSVSSVTGALMAMRGEVAYATAKAALVGLTRALAVDEARHGITVNAVAPGWIATGSQTDLEVLEGNITPLGRSGVPAEVASAVAWLASPGAAYVTGTVVVVDGGNSIVEERAHR